MIFLILVAALCFWGWRQYVQKKSLGASPSPAVFLSTNSETSNTANVAMHCLQGGVVDEITGKSYSLENEVYTPAVTLLECSYLDSTMISNVYPTIKYKAQLSSDANGIWNKKRTALKGSATFIENGDFPNIFADINPVREIDQGTFYGKSSNAYFELTYTPVAEGSTLLISHGMNILQKALSN